MLDINIYSMINSLIGACILIILCPFMEKLIIRGQISSSTYFFAFLLIICRLLLPFEVVGKTYFVQIEKLLPSIVRLLKTEISILPSSTSRLHIEATLLEAVLLFLFSVSAVKCFKLFADYYSLCKSMKFVLSSGNKTVEKVLCAVREDCRFNFPVRVIQNKYVDSPFEFGLFRQTICLPDIPYSEEELYFILSHELHHFSSKSNWLKFFNNILASVLWWNPLITFYNTSIVSMIELNCDEHVITGFNDRLKAKYLSCLLSELRPQHNTKANGTIHLLSPNEKLLSKRYHFITAKHKKSKAVFILSVLLMLSVFFASYFFMVLPYCDTLASETKTPKFIKENSYILKKGDAYIIYYENEPYIYSETISDTFSDLTIIEED